MSNQSLTFEKTIKAPSTQVYRAFTNSSALREWMCDGATADPRPGGRLYMWWNAGFYTSGEFTALEEDKSISYTWFGRGEPSPTQVKITLTEKNGDTHLFLEHSGVGSGEAWTSVVEEFKRGWENGLGNLVSVLETGQDLRFTRRPMLGIILSDFNADIASQLGIPVSEGIRLDSTVDGMGAQAAGLQNDDVIVAMAGQDVTDFSSLSNALSGKRSGDKVEVTFYRGPEKMKVTMELSGRPIPEIPATASALAQQVAQRYAEIESQLDEFFNGITEEEASYKPGQSEWSAKEVMAHLIQGESAWRDFISDVVGGHEPRYDGFGGNLQARIEATLAVFPTIQEMIAELKRNWKETVEFLSRLPDEFLPRKGSYWRVAYNALQSPYHFNSHLEQMNAAVAAARGK